MEKLKICKVRNVETPRRAHDEDAGIDFWVPYDIDVDTFNSKCALTGDHVEYTLTDDGKISTIILKPNESVLLPSGIKVKVPSGYMLQFTNKSGVAAKKHLIVGSSVVDVGYEGECHINLHNISNRNQEIHAGDKIVQAILIPVNFAHVDVVGNETELFGIECSARGEGGFGSTDTK